MNKKRFFMMGGSRFKLPYTFNPASYGNGGLPSPWLGTTFSIVSGKAINTPTVGVELLTDGGLEATYTGGLCDSLARGGLPTLADAAPDVHGGAHAQEFTGVAGNNYVQFPTIAVPVNHTWYRATGYTKRTAGANGFCMMGMYQGGGVPVDTSFSRGISDAAYTLHALWKRTNSANPLNFRPAFDLGWAGFDTAHVDDFTLKTGTQSSYFALLPAVPDPTTVTVKARYTWNPDYPAGIVARCNNDRTSFLVGYYYNDGYAYCHCILDQCVAGVWSNLIYEYSNQAALAAGGDPLNTQWIEIRPVAGHADQVAFFHNNIQVGADVTINAALVSNRLFGQFNLGGSQLESFFLGV